MGRVTSSSPETTQHITNLSDVMTATPDGLQGYMVKRWHIWTIWGAEDDLSPSCLGMAAVRRQRSQQAQDRAERRAWD
ncbi:hypothetical protein DL768_011575 [Monosporascus sp. mg162]|nr:hypothetical protein DL768_011575 [Monosporascus sp. mg162]